MTNNHAPLVNAVGALPDVKQASDLVRLTEDQWKSLIRAPGVGVPADTPGATVEEQINHYVERIVGQVEAAFPTPFFAERLATSPVKAFLQTQPAYDLKTTYPAQFFKANPVAGQALNTQESQRLHGFQRLYRLTDSTKETLALAAKGIVHSAQQIAQLDRSVFADQHTEIFAAERANEVYNRALRTVAMTHAVFGEHSASLNRTALHVLPKLDSLKQETLAKDSIPDWQTLFGAFDFCTCHDCASAHGPAAYFVDILHFLGERGISAPLFARRSDLGDIELSCENTNTPVPLIDLANEVLENAVAPPAAFTPLTLEPALEADLAQAVATQDLTGKFNPPLQPGARVETLEAGKRWRIWDEPFAYSVVKDTGALKVVARSRQTTGSADERRATPQYRNGAAYTELGKAVYPWDLPFDLAAEEAKVFLTHLGVTRHDLIEALRPELEPFNPNSPVVTSMAAERLGLTDTQGKIIAGEPLVPPRQAADFWGSASVAVLTTVQELLDRAGLRYAELDALVATWFINPAAAVTISAKTGAPIDTCDTTKLQINGLTADVLDRLHRFVRLWRKLGWTIPETDRAIRGLAPDPNTPALSNEVLVRLDHLRALCAQLRLSVARTFALWKPIGTAEPGSLYRDLFDNPAVFRTQDEDFRLRPDGGNSPTPTSC